MAIQPDFSNDAPETESPASTAPEGGAPDAAEDSPSPEATAKPSNTPEIPEIDKFERFKLGGQEWTKKDLTESILRHSDYTRKTQELAQERKFYDNLAADLEQVRTNPTLADQFRKIYPEKFHRYLGYVSPKQEGNQPETSKEQTLDPKIASRIEQLEKLVTEDKVQALESRLEAQDQKFAAKYQMADIEAVYARAQAEHSKGTKLTEEKWEELWKADHDRHQKRYEAHYKKQVETQKAATRGARDMGAGGGTPGQAPKRTALKNVADEYIASQES